ncbi:MAG: DUF523 and DUF1722 domain-containing protein [Syntrophales bacterium]|nr:DUF523 and DUF1722 domain-containing protein [Syntrophales bacterium]MCK9527361.1 DUF523 and DUF1722 domain-containing protein [Syntrophales bacterium]MDX9921463.1 DUF523 and DUF1722 domain-containing protein [Syntrophales bacterium]
MKKIPIGISTCLLGENVRYDGGHKLDRFLRDTLGRYVRYIPVCPEADCGMGIPREFIRLEGSPESPRLVTGRTKVDKTDMMVSWAKKRLIQLEGEDLHGFIFKSGSPSCGTERIKVYDDKGLPVKRGTGVFARMFMDHFPSVPVKDEKRLHDADLREHFIERIFVLKRWRDTQKAPPGRDALVGFHGRHGLLVLSHSSTHYRAMEKLVADRKRLSRQELYEGYETLLMKAMEMKTTVKKNVTVLRHILGYLRRNLSSDEKTELLEVIETYQNGFLPLIVPITLIGHYARKYGQHCLNEQVYLNPRPRGLQMCDHPCQDPARRTSG